MKITKISTKEELLSLEKDGNYVLTNDVDLENEVLKNPVLTTFSGVLDGQGYSIKNFIIEKNYENRQGFFNTVRGLGAKICNLTIENAYFDPYCTSGIITGCLEEGAIIDNCTIKNSTLNGQYNNTYGVGFFCGKMNSFDIETPAYITNCTLTDCKTQASGIVGKMYYSEMRNCKVMNTEYTYKYGGGALVSQIFCSIVENCTVVDCKLLGESEALFYESNNSEIINSMIITPEKELDEDILQKILESDSAYDQLKDRDELSLWGIYTQQIVDFPEVISKLTKLKRLNIGNNLWKSIPDSITQLQNLEELQLDCALSGIDRLPDLSKLKNLNRLRANGNNWIPNSPLPSQNLLPHILKATQVEFLEISDWGEARRKGKLVRQALDIDLLNDLKNMSNLKMLDLSNNALESVPPILIKLDLEYIDLSYNRLPDYSKFVFGETNMIINLEHNRPSVSDMNGISQYGKELLKRKLQQNAIEVFDSIIEQSSQDELDNYTTQYAYFGKMSAYNSLLTDKDYSFSKKQIKDYQKELLKIASQVLELVKKYPLPQDVPSSKYLQMEMGLVANQSLSKLKKEKK